jgi:hypothetical protein
MQVLETIANDKGLSRSDRPFLSYVLATVRFSCQFLWHVNEAKKMRGRSSFDSSISDRAEPIPSILTWRPQPQAHARDGKELWLLMYFSFVPAETITLCI